jgi:DNA topoisomerase-6 subunit B
MTADSLPTAFDLASRQREISVAEFFLKNRHLLGFDSGAKALLTTVKEAVDNALDACEEAGILPEIRIEVKPIPHADDVFVVVVEDNGPGIVESQLSRIFGKLLYGSKFHKLAQSRGQQGMGISAAGMYAQLTTGKPLHVLSRVAGQTRATELYVSIDTAKNRPEMHKKQQVKWNRRHGTRVEAELQGYYQKGPHSIDMYLNQTAIANPHVTLRFENPNDEKLRFIRSVSELPAPPVSVKPHPHGVELGMLIQMLNNTHCRTLLPFLEQEFSRVGRKTARAIIAQAGNRLSARSYPRHIARAQAQALYHAMQEVPVSAPRTDCLVPIGEKQLEAGLRKELKAEFYTVVTRPAAVYRGNPFQVEVAIAYGRPGGVGLEVAADGHIHKAARQRQAAKEEATDASARLLRFANRVPLLYEPGACAITKAVMQTNWRAYGLRQSKGALPIAPMIIMVHIASVWVPFTSEAKEAVAGYAEILKELKLGLQACGRRLASHLRQTRRLQQEYDKRTHIEKHLPQIGNALQDILQLSDTARDKAMSNLDKSLHRRRKIR